MESREQKSNREMTGNERINSFCDEILDAIDERIGSGEVNTVDITNYLKITTKIGKIKDITEGRI